MFFLLLSYDKGIMSEKHKLAGAKRWEGISAKKRSKEMSDLVKRRHSKMTKKQKREYALKMVRAREVKKNNENISNIPA